MFLDYGAPRVLQRKEEGGAFHCGCSSPPSARLTPDSEALMSHSIFDRFSFGTNWKPFISITSIPLYSSYMSTL